MMVVMMVTPQKAIHPHIDTLVKWSQTLMFTVVIIVIVCWSYVPLMWLWLSDIYRLESIRVSSQISDQSMQWTPACISNACTTTIFRCVSNLLRSYLVANEDKPRWWWLWRLIVTYCRWWWFPSFQISTPLLSLSHSLVVMNHFRWLLCIAHKIQSI